MHKFLILSLVLLPDWSWAKDCEVDGISDSPQSMNCYIHNGKLMGKLDLRCKDTKYKMEWKGKTVEVTNAYHEDVEQGSSPLVFIADEMALTTISYKVYSMAELVIGEKTYKGLCFSYK